MVMIQNRLTNGRRNISQMRKPPNKACTLTCATSAAKPKLLILIMMASLFVSVVAHAGNASRYIWRIAPRRGLFPDWVGWLVLVVIALVFILS